MLKETESKGQHEFKIRDVSFKDFQFLFSEENIDVCAGMPLDVTLPQFCSTSTYDVSMYDTLDSDSWSTYVLGKLAYRCMSLLYRMAAAFICRRLGSNLTCPTSQRQVHNVAILSFRDCMLL